MISAVTRIKEVKELGVEIIDHCPDSRKLSIIASIKSMDAVACVRKYLVAASIDRG